MAAGMAAATESTVCFDVSDEPISVSSASRSPRLHCDDDEPGTGDGLGVREGRFDTVLLVQLVGTLLAARGDDDLALPPPAR